MRPQVRDLYNALPELADRVIYIPFWEKRLYRSGAAFARLPFITRSEASFLTYPAARSEYAIFSRAISSKNHFSHAYPAQPAVQLLAHPRTIRVPIAHKHNVLRNLDLLEAAGIRTSVPDGYVVPQDWTKTTTNSNRVLLHIGSIAHNGLESRRWPVKSFLELGKALRAKSIDVALISGPAEREETAFVARALSNADVIVGTIPEIARAISGAAMLVANDNGIAHLAAAVRTPVIALMGPTPIEHGPYGGNSIAFRPTSCLPCFNITTTDSRCALNIDYACLKKDIEIADVLSMVTKSLNDRVTELPSHQ